ncbi:hypothetical protein I3760_Q020500 [Carya illinoinensis]|nr:hypothetical protein I3760_Q020500 [Carya illinoinensis]
MAASDGPPPMAAPIRSFADLVSTVPQPLPVMEVPFRQPKIIDGELVFTFSAKEIDKLAQPFRFSIVLKFLRQRPSLDAVSFVVGGGCLACRLFQRCSVQDTFSPFAWTPEFDENSEPLCVPVWVFLPGLPPSFYQPSVLKMITAPIGRFIRCDNSTMCATRTDGARVCLEVDSSKAPINYFWIGKPGVPRSRRQEIIFKTLPAYCSKCKCQGHNTQTCRKENDQKKHMKGSKKWVKIDVQPTDDRVTDLENRGNPEKEVQKDGLVPHEVAAVAENLPMLKSDINGKEVLEDETRNGHTASMEMQNIDQVPRHATAQVYVGEPSSSNGHPGQEFEHGVVLVSEMRVEKSVVSVLGLIDKEGSSKDIPSFQITELMEDGSSLNDGMTIPNNDGEHVEHLISVGCNDGGNKELAAESQSDHEIERVSMREDMQKDYCTDSEGMTKKAGKFLKRNSTRAITRPNKPKIIALAEPFLREDKIPTLLGKYNCDSFVTNERHSGKIWLLWNSDISIQWLNGSNQFVSVKVEENGFVFILTIVYAKCNPVERKNLWEDLVELSNGNLPWILCGDFNIIREDSERRGGNPRPFTAMGDFNFWLQNCGVMDIKSQGASMTWCNGQSGLARSWARLDRCFLNSIFLNCYPNVFSQVLSRSTSGHSPLVIKMGEDPFRYGLVLFVSNLCGLTMQISLASWRVLESSWAWFWSF